jgi:enterochelin esterase-like enzyme
MLQRIKILLARLGVIHRQMRVYTPPGYSVDRKYPVLILLHGIGGNDREWTQACHADNILDNLLAEGKIQPMVVVFPNDNSSVTADAVGAFPERTWARVPLLPEAAQARAAALEADGADSKVGGRHSRTTC